MEADTIDVIEEEEEALARPSSWHGALAQLPGFPADAAPSMPSIVAGTPRDVTSALQEDLAGEEEAVE